MIFWPARWETGIIISHCCALSCFRLHTAGYTNRLFRTELWVSVFWGALVRLFLFDAMIDAPVGEPEASEESSRPNLFCVASFYNLAKHTAFGCAHRVFVIACGLSGTCYPYRQNCRWIFNCLFLFRWLADCLKQPLSIWGHYAFITLKYAVNIKAGYECKCQYI